MSSYLPMIPNLKERQNVTESEAKQIWLEAKTPLVSMMIKTLWCTGLRITEALMLTARDVIRDGYDYSLQVMTEKVGKVVGESKPDVIPLPRAYALDLIDYIRQYIRPGGRLFPVHRATAWRQIQACAKRAGLSNWRQIHPHSFRHGFIYDKAKKGVHPYILSKLARHTQLKTTLGYYQPSQDDLRQAMEK